jgi:CspA family cold shock protein
VASDKSISDEQRSFELGWNVKHKEESSMAEGIVKWFSDKKGYGFIEREEGKDLFVHHSSIDMGGFRTLAEGDRVSFEVNDTDRGPEAKNVKKV